MTHDEMRDKIKQYMKNPKMAARMGDIDPDKMSDDEMYAMIEKMDKLSGKTMSKDEELMSIRRDFDMMIHPEHGMDMPKPTDMVLEVYENYVIVSYDGKYYKVGYEKDGEKINFDLRDKWVEVEEQWTQKKEAKNALKAVLESPYELVVENHIVLFGGRDLTGHAIGENPDGSLGEYFSKATDLESDYTKTGRLYVDFEHGRDPDAIGNNPDTVLGYVDWKTAKTDDEGVIVRRVLNRRHKYMKWLEPLIRAGMVGNSSQSVGSQIEKAEDGEIKKWALKRDTLTFTPMEPRMIDQNAITALKALAEDIPYYKAIVPDLLPPDTALPDKDEKTIQPIIQRKKIMEKKMEKEFWEKVE